MFISTLLTFFLINGLSEDLASPDFRIREKATYQLSIQILEEEKPIVYNQMAELVKSGEPEVKWRAYAILEVYLSQGEFADLPIWALPKDERYKNGEDLVKTYYFLHVGPRWEVANDSKLARLLFQQYIRERFRERSINMTSLDDLLERMESLYVKEQNLIRGHPYWTSMPNDRYSVPGAIEDRIKSLTERVDITKEQISHGDMPDYSWDMDFFEYLYKNKIKIK